MRLQASLQDGTRRLRMWMRFKATGAHRLPSTGNKALSTVYKVVWTVCIVAASMATLWSKYRRATRSSWGLRNGTFEVLGSTGYNVNITGSRADLDVMFGVLRRAGLTPDSRPVEKHSNYSTYWRTEGFRVWVWFTSTSCKRVQVGTKVEEVPVYETVCEE